MNSARFILCADDFALSASSSQGIIDLLAKSRLSAVSCVVNTELWPQHGPMLLPFHSNAYPKRQGAQGCQEGSVHVVHNRPGIPQGNTVAAQKPKSIYPKDFELRQGAQGCQEGSVHGVHNRPGIPQGNTVAAQKPKGIYPKDFELRQGAQGCQEGSVHGVHDRPGIPQGNTVAAQKPKGIDVGLHFNLTEGAWISQPNMHDIGLKQLILKAYTHRLSTAMIMQELLAQLNAFTQIMGQPPDFIDGHQHIQQFPVIRHAILAWFNMQKLMHKTYIRCTHLQYLSNNDSMKRWIINRLGAKTLKNQLEKTSIRHNKTFSGVYDFSPHANYRHLFQQFLREVDNQGIIMCHPAQGFDPSDPHTLARQQEWAYFISDDFIEDCTTAGMSLSRGDFLSASLRGSIADEASKQ